MNTTFFLLLSTILPLCSPYFYIRSILKGDAKPHRTTRFVYLIIGLLTTSSLLVSGNTVALAISSVSLLQSIALFILSFRYGVGGWEKTSIICFILALIGVAAWQMTSNPIIGLYAGILADFAGSIPTIRKTIVDPRSEEPRFYAIDAVAGFFNILALPTLSFQAASYPLYLFGINGLITVLALRSKNSRIHSNN